MTVATTLFIVIGALAIYYIGMVAYDLYADKMSKSESEESKEESIDVSDQLDGFASFDVAKPDEEIQKRKSLESFLCKGLTPEKIYSMMEDASTGTPNDTLRNILHMCYQIQAEPA